MRVNLRPCSLALAIAAFVILQGCGTREVEKFVPQPYEVKVPVLVERKPPDSLLQRYVPIDTPVFVDPSAADVVYGLRQQDWERLQIILRTMQTRDQAWRSWATGKGDPNE